jgi:hypothetical protein
MNAMKDAYAESPTQFLNIFVSRMDERTLDGYARFPWESVALTDLGGLWLNAEAMGNGSHTITHEMGHCLGLWHTFHGVRPEEGIQPCSDCYEFASGFEADRRGDFCSDTRSLPEWYECFNPPGADCEGTSWGATPLNNFMGYSWDCMTRFTDQQRLRMHCWTAANLRGLLTSTVAVQETDDRREFLLRVDPWNPTAGGIRFAYSLPADGFVRLGIFDITGRQITPLVGAPQARGEHVATWGGLLASGGRAVSGMYIVRLAFRGRFAMQKFIFLK